MNSIQDLNGFGNTSLSFTDNRDPQIIFDRPLPINQTISTNQADTHSVPYGMDILEFIDPATLSTSYTIDVSSVPGGTITWDTIPSGCAVLNPLPGIYTITGINSVAIWNQVKSPTYTPDPAFVGVFSYSSRLDWNPSQSVSWTVTVTINDITNMSAAEDFYFLGGDSGDVTGNPEIIDNYATTWSVTITPSTTEGYLTLATDGTGGTVDFNSITKVMTINGTKTEVNSHLNSMTFTSSDTTKSDFTLQYTAINDTTGEGDVKIQNWYTTEYLSAVRADAAYTYNTISSITNGPLITDVYSDGQGTYTMAITPSPTASTLTMSSTGRPGFVYGQTIDCPQPNSPYATGARWPDGIAFSGDSQYMAIGFRLHYDNFAPLDRSSLIYIYEKTASTYNFSTSIGPTGEVYNESDYDMGTLSIFGTEVALDSDGSTMLVGSPREDVSSSTDTNEGALYVFTRSGSTWTQQARLTPSDDREEDQIGTPGRIAISADGNTIVASAPRLSFGGSIGADVVGCVFTWTRSGGSWTQQTTLTPGDGLATDAFGYQIAMDSTASTMAVVSYSGTSPYSGYVYIYTGSAGSWTQQTKISTFNGSSVRIRYVTLSADGNTMIASDGYDMYIHTRSGSTWTFDQKISSTSNIVPIKLTDDGLTILTKNKIYKYLDDEFQVDQVPEFIGTRTISPDGEFVAGANQTATVSGYANAGAAYIYNYDTIGTSWNASTKTLTLTGTRSQVNADMDTIQLTPINGYTDDFQLVYNLTTPEFIIDDRTQNVIGA